VPDLRPWLRRAALSISRAGYNTTVELLAAAVPAVVVADERMSDQPFRAARLDLLGLAAAAEANADSIEAAIRRVLASPRNAPRRFRLDGARETRRILERLAG
jgi:predicted glycosyltransferase